MADCLKCFDEVVWKKRDPSDSHCYHDVEEKLGLECVASFDDPEASYSFDKFSIWKRGSDEALFYGTDSGCSCPTPFEDIHSVADLTKITKSSWENFKTAFGAYCSKRCGYYEKGQRFVEIQAEADTLAMVSAILNKR